MQIIRKITQHFFKYLLWILKVVLVDAYMFTAVILFFAIVACLPFAFYWNFIPGAVFMFFALKLQTKIERWVKLYS